MIYLGIPSYDGKVNSDLANQLAALRCSEQVHIEIRGSSFLTECFNEILCAALNWKECTHLLLVHADVAPVRSDFPQLMLDELRAQGTDAIGAVLPIKDQRGLTSTALRGADGAVRRLTIREALKLPASFGLKELAAAFGCAAEGAALYINTGMWLLDLRRRESIAGLPFQVRNEIRRVGDGQWAAASLSEDWDWSERAAEAGLVLRATRAVAAGHMGQMGFCNCCEWGTAAKDTGD